MGAYVAGLLGSTYPVCMLHGIAVCVARGSGTGMSILHTLPNAFETSFPLLPQTVNPKP